MGGYGSGRQGGRPTADASCKIDLAWMMRQGWAVEGQRLYGTLSWSCGGQPSGSISYTSIMDDPGHERLELSYTRGPDHDRESVKQTVRLTYTRPKFGGKRWWMICPFSGLRVGKLYLPGGGDRFAGRKAWRLGYQSQRITQRDAVFERLFKLQRKLNGTQGWEQPICRPKGMWHRTFDRLENQYWQLDHQCAAAMLPVVERLRASLK
jgi:hypothetical protein